MGCHGAVADTLGVEVQLSALSPIHQTCMLLCRCFPASYPALGLKDQASQDRVDARELRDAPEAMAELEIADPIPEEGLSSCCPVIW